MTDIFQHDRHTIGEFIASHPVFGLITPTVREALEAGKKLAEEGH